MVISPLNHMLWLDFRSAQAECGCTDKFGRPRKSWDEVIKNDRKKLDMDSADPQNCSEWRGRLQGILVKSQTLGRGKEALKWI